MSSWRPPSFSRSVSPQYFLQIAGMGLVVLGVLGVFRPDIAGSWLQFDALENIVHILLGLAALIVAPLPIGFAKQWIVGGIGVGAVLAGVIGFVLRDAAFPNIFGITNFENPVQTGIYMVLGIWGLAVAFRQAVH